MQYKCENNAVEQIDEISLTSILIWIGYATISTRNATGVKTDNDR